MLGRRAEEGEHIASENRHLKAAQPTVGAAQAKLSRRLES